jgi:hypothetical protein
VTDVRDHDETAVGHLGRHLLHVLPWDKWFQSAPRDEVFVADRSLAMPEASGLLLAMEARRSAKPDPVRDAEGLVDKAFE